MTAAVRMDVVRECAERGHEAERIAHPGDRCVCCRAPVGMRRAGEVLGPIPILACDCIPNDCLVVSNGGRNRVFRVGADGALTEIHHAPGAQP